MNQNRGRGTPCLVLCNLPTSLYHRHYSFGAIISVILPALPVIDIIQCAPYRVSRFNKRVDVVNSTRSADARVMEMHADFRERLSALQCILERCMRAVNPMEPADRSSNRRQECLIPHVRIRGQELLQKAQIALDEFLRLAVQVGLDGLHSAKHRHTS